MLRRLPFMPDVRSLPLLEQLDLLRADVARLKGGVLSMFDSDSQLPGSKSMQEKCDAYDRLILSVAQKFPGETRHQTALRYIEQSERISREAPEDLENLRMQLVACMTASAQNTRTAIKDRIERGHPYWSQAYADVCAAIDREIALREEVEVLRNEMGSYPEGLGMLSSADIEIRRRRSERQPPVSRPIVNPGDRPVLRYVEVTPDFPRGADTPERYRLHLEFLVPGRPVIEAYHIEIPFRRGSETHEVLVQLNSLGIEVKKFHRQLIASQTSPLPLGEEDVARGRPPGT